MAAAARTPENYEFSSEAVAAFFMSRLQLVIDAMSRLSYNKTHEWRCICLRSVPSRFPLAASDKKQVVVIVPPCAHGNRRAASFVYGDRRSDRVPTRSIRTLLAEETSDVPATVAN